MVLNIIKFCLLLFFSIACSEMTALKKKEPTKHEIALEQEKLKKEILEIKEELEKQSEHNQALENRLDKKLEVFKQNMQMQLSAFRLNFYKILSDGEANPFEIEQMIKKNLDDIQKQMDLLKKAEENEKRIAQLEERFELYKKESEEEIERLNYQWQEGIERLSQKVQSTSPNSLKWQQLKKELERKLIETSAEIQTKIEKDLENHELVGELREELERIKEITETTLGKDEASAIVSDLFSPCHNGLKNLENCYTIGNSIIRLGGIFLDPSHFDRGISGLLEYFSASGLQSDIFFKEDLYKSYLYPENTSNKEALQTCYDSGEDVLEDLDANDLALIPPQDFWVRGVVIGLVVDRMEKILVDLKKSKLVKQNVKPIQQINSWWRSECYDKAINDKDESQSDHLDASAMDLQFAESGGSGYYYDFIKGHFWDSDFFNIRSALSFESQAYSLGLGVHDSFLHLSVGAKKNQEENSDRRIWDYDTSLGFHLDDFLSMNRP